LYVFAPGIERVSDSGTQERAGALVSVRTRRRRYTEVPIVDEQHEYLKVAEVARIIRVARSGAYELVAEGENPSIRIGRSVRVSRRELDRWLEEQRQPSARWK
jgi:excisionase family DNA binding protein